MRSADLPTTRALVRAVAAALVTRGLTLATAESVTGGAIATACTALPDSSRWFEAAFVTYRVAAKSAVLDVPPALIERYGVVSEPVVRAMAEGALVRCAAHIAVATTGIAGPAGGEPQIPVGSVWFAWAIRDAQRIGIVRTALHRFTGTRRDIRRASVRVALAGVLTAIGQQ